ncbi:hypothetical protein [Mammaliicoccus sciuri]|uniref:hypothetical protein n=1 Tax=Mammaliicoccus sciuri TaxID=1296 RepID=UPI000B115CFB|nr:hypothetical protein [Mammaliicoccus sciuri]
MLNWIIYRINAKILFLKWSLIISFIINTVYLYSYQNVEPIKELISQYYPFSAETFIIG